MVFMMILNHFLGVEHHVKNTYHSKLNNVIDERHNKSIIELLENKLSHWPFLIEEVFYYLFCQ